jgi:CHASE2 domain-containing sensor protein
MKKFVLDFIRRGLIGCGFGPLVLAILYGILEHQGLLETLPVRQVCMAIFSISALAFIAGGINAIYQLERLPLMVAILIHGAVLYGSYLVTYLLNDWLEWGPVPVMFFTGIFVVGYLAIWAVIYRVIRRNTARVNEVLKRQQAHLE